MASTQSLFTKTVNLYEKKKTLRNIGRNVVIQALEDALGRQTLNKNYGFSQSNAAKLAQSYFTEPNGDFKTVCTLAGFDHEYIRMKEKQYFNRKNKDAQKNMSKV